MPHTLPITGRFADLRAAKHMAFMPFVTAGDPDLATTREIIRALAAEGVDLIEIGFPYSDPIADGPVIQASYTRALGRKVRVDDIFAAVAALHEEAAETIPPLVAMVSYAIVFRVGVERFLGRARDAGFAGLIVPDLPGDEAEELAGLAADRGMDLVQLVSPTTPPERAAKLLRAASGFVYCVSVAGTTGVRDELPPALSEQLKWLRSQTDLPLAVGFGISRPEQIEPLRGLADGIIVGSAIVRQVAGLSEGTADLDETLKQVREFAARFVAAAHG